MPEKKLSPCNGVCIVEDGVCVECNRTLTDIEEWPSMSEEERIKRILELEEEMERMEELED